MVNNSKDIGELINKLETPLGRAKAVLAISKQYQVPEENVREAIATFEAVYDSNETQNSWHSEQIDPLIYAANLAVKIFWIEKAVDLKAKAGKTSDAAELAEEFGLDKKAFELYKQDARQVHNAVKLAEKLELWDEYIKLCEQDGRPEDAIKKCKELGRQRDAEQIFTKMFMYKTQHRITEYLKQVADIAKQTGFEEYALDLCKEHKKDRAMAVIAAELGKPRLAAMYFESVNEYAEAARQALQINDGDKAESNDKAIELFLKEASRLQKRNELSESLKILKEIPITADSGDAVLSMIFDCYALLKKFECGAKYFEELKYCGVQQEIPRALALLEKGNLLQEARAVAERHGLADKVKEYTEKLGWNVDLAKIASEEGNSGQSLAYYNAEIENQRATKNYYSAAITALEAAKLCKKQSNKELAKGFKEQAKELFALESKKKEENGHWNSAAESAEQAGNPEKAKLYRQINALANAYHAH